MSEIIAEYYNHIDNGGISLEITKDKDDGIELTIDTSYFGYPSITTKLYLGIESDNVDKILSEMSDTLKEAAVKLRKNTKG